MNKVEDIGWARERGGKAHFVGKASARCGRHFTGEYTLVPDVRDKDKCQICVYAIDRHRIVVYLDEELLDAIPGRRKTNRTDDFSWKVELSKTLNSLLRGDSKPEQYLTCKECGRKASADPSTWMDGWPKCHNRMMIR
jgi:hypothetical protein